MPKKIQITHKNWFMIKLFCGIWISVGISNIRPTCDQWMISLLEPHPDAWSDWSLLHMKETEIYANQERVLKKSNNNKLERGGNIKKFFKKNRTFRLVLSFGTAVENEHSMLEPLWIFLWDFIGQRCISTSTSAVPSRGSEQRWPLCWDGLRKPGSCYSAV